MSTKFLGPQMIEAGQTFEFRFPFSEIDPPFRAKQLIVPKTVPRDINLVDARVKSPEPKGYSIPQVDVAREKQVVGLFPNPVPIAAFMESAMGVYLGLPTARYKDELQVLVQNTGDKPQLFVGVLHGDHGDDEAPAAIPPPGSRGVVSGPPIMGPVPVRAFDGSIPHWHAPGGYVGASERAPIPEPVLALGREMWPQHAHDGAIIATIMRYLRIHNLQPSDVEVREFVMGFGPTTVARQVQHLLQAEPQIDLFIPRRIIVPSSVGPNFEIHDVRVGMNSQRESSRSIPASDLDEDAPVRDKNLGRGPAITFKNAAKLGHKISLSIRNIKEVEGEYRADTFSAAIIGTGVCINDNLIVEA